MHGAYSEIWWWQCPSLVMLVSGNCISYHEFADVLLYIEREVFQHDNNPKHTSKATVAFL
ncbi:unnamed protein product, partial [Staurois parvus]